LPPLAWCGECIRPHRCGVEIERTKTAGELPVPLKSLAAIRSGKAVDSMGTPQRVEEGKDFEPKPVVVQLELRTVRSPGEKISLCDKCTGKTACCFSARKRLLGRVSRPAARTRVL
jgi:hypothetical protein